MKNFVFLSSLIFFLIFISCNNDIGISENESKQKLESSVRKDVNLTLKKDFSKALAKILAENKDVRELIKNEALKKIDNDYDVVYQLIKDEKLKSGITLYDLLLSYIEPDKLALINSQIPTLTIFVPTLPESTFSAEIWDINNDIPFVGIRTNETNDVPIFDSEGNESIISANNIPAFPIVVVKECERIAVVNNLTKAGSDNMTIINPRSDSSLKFTFLNEAFDNVDNDPVLSSDIRVNEAYSSVDTKGGRSDPQIPEDLKKVYEAYDIYNSTNNWQRDYVYYNITPANPKGPFFYNFKEHLVGFQMLGNPMGCINKIADQTGDPRLDGKWHSHNQGTYNILSGWTDGEFEFKVKIYVGNKSQVGTEYITYFRVDPQSLFKVESTKDYIEDKNTFTVKNVTLLRTSLSLPLFEWNLENYGSSVKIGLEEVDSQQSTVVSSSTSVEFATNFSFDVPSGEQVKVGLKFGASQKDTKTVSYQVTTTSGNDDLGEVIVNFADDVIVSKKYVSTPNIYGTGGSSLHPDFNNKYFTGWYKIHIAPKKVN